MQKSPNLAVLAVMVNATHHQRGAGCSTTPEMRSVSQLKLRRFNTSGMRLISRSACCNPKSKIESREVILLRYPLHNAGNPDVLCVGHLWIWIANTRQVTGPR